MRAAVSVRNGRKPPARIVHRLRVAVAQLDALQRRLGSRLAVGFNRVVGGGQRPGACRIWSGCNQDRCRSCRCRSWTKS